MIILIISRAENFVAYIKIPYIMTYYLITPGIIQHLPRIIFGPEPVLIWQMKIDQILRQLNSQPLKKKYR